MSVKKASSSLVSRSRVGFTPTGGGAAVTISNVIVTDSNWNNLDDTAVGTSSSYIKIIGSGFVVNPSVYIGTTQVSSGNITFVSSTELRVVLPNLSLGTQNLFVFNTDYSGAIWSAGLVVSGFPDFTQTTYTSSTPLSVSVQLVATGDAPLTYALQGGSSLPAGTTLSSSGLITGTTTDGTYQFTVIVSDAQNQSFQQQLTLTITSTDQYFNITPLAINADVDTFVRDASTNNFPVTITGDTKPFSFSPYNTNWSIYIDGSDDLNAASNAAFTYGTADFTIEGWFYVTGRSGGNDYEYFFAQGANTGASALGLYRQGDVLKVWQGGPSAALTGTTAFSTLYNRWVHIALTRSGTTMRLFLNGALEGSATNSGNITTGTTTGISIGRWTEIGDGNYIIGYVSNFRVVKGTAVYTSAFTPSTTPLTAITNTSLLTCQSNRLRDNSSNNLTLTKNGDTAVKSFGPFTETDTTTGSAYFDGTSDYIDVAHNANLTPSGDFTIEFWAYPTSGSGIREWYTKGAGIQIYSNATTWYVALSANNSSTYFVNSTFGTLLPNQWQHIVLSRSGNTYVGFINGVASALVTSSSAPNTGSDNLRIGDYSGAGGYPILGYVSNVRFVNGTAVYGTSSFTPPTSPLTAVANTQLLLLQTRQPVNNHTFIDTSGNNIAVTRNGNVTQGSFSPFSPAGWSNYFDGSGDYLTAPSNAAFTLGSSGDFTIECWFYLTASPSNYAPLMTTWTNASNSYINRWAINFYNSKLSWYTDAGNLGVADTSNIELNTWIHVAVVRNGSNITMYKNGVSLGVQSTVQSYTTDNTLSIGYIAGGAYITGYISNARIVKGTAVYTSNFTPSTAALSAIANTSLLTCQSNRFKDNSTNNFTITKTGDTRVTNFSPFKPTAAYSPVTHEGSAYFDGTGDYLRATAQTFSSNFTLECWIYPFRLADTQNVGEIFATVSPNTQFYVNNSGQLGYYNTSTSTLSSANAIVTNTWQHIAICRSGTTTRLFVNGQVVATNSSDSGNRIFTDIGTFADGNAYYFQGYISDARWTSADLYTSAFTPPTAPLASISNTVLNLPFNNAAIVDVSSRNVMETVGDAKIVTSTRKYGTGSMYFDGTGDYLASYSELTKLNCTFRTGDFTIEAWVNFATVGTDLGITDVATSTTTASSSQWYLYRLSTNVIGFGNHGAGAIISSTTTTLASTWYHVAVTRSGTSLRLFVNGNLQSTVTNSTDYIAASLHLGLVGTPYLMNGYIDDFRITKGFARYTANFTPPTSTFLTQ